MSRIIRHPYLLVFLAGLLIRLALIFLDYSFDVNNHIVWAHDLLVRGPSGFYDTISSDVFATLYPNYPPGALILFVPFYLLSQAIFSLVWWLNVQIPLFPSQIVFFVQDRAFVAGLLKLPAIFADLGIAWMVMFFIKKLVPRSQHLRLAGASFILFHPTFFYNSAYWGQIDAIPLFFAMSALYLALFTKRSLASALLFTFGILVKPTIFVFLPVYAIVYVRQYGFKKTLTSVIVSNGAFLFSFLPFFHSFMAIFSSYSVYYVKILEAQSLPYVTNGAFNAWLILTQLRGITVTEPFLFGVSYQIWGYGLTGLAVSIILYFFLKQKQFPLKVLFASMLVVCAVILFLTQMHERYLLLPLPFLLLMAVSEKKYRIPFYGVSVISFLNLYHSFAVPRVEALVSFLDVPFVYTLLCIVNVLMFFYLLKDFSVKRDGPTGMLQ